MICPKCHTENSQTAKFCRSCGNSLVVEEPITSVEKETQPVCEKCQNPLKANARFCPKCGSPVPAAETEAIPAPQAKPEVIPAPEPAPAPAPQAKPEVIPAPEPAPAPAPQAKPEAAPAPKKNKGLVAVAIVLGVLIVLLVIAGVLFLTGSKPGFTQKTEDAVHTGSQEQTEEAAGEADTPEEGQELSEEEMAAILGPIDEMADSGMEEVEDDEELYSGLEHLKEAISLYQEAAEQIGNQGLINSKISSAFESYCYGTMTEVDILWNQPMDGGVGERYGQMVDSLSSALSFGSELVKAGYEVDTTEIEMQLQTVTTEYPEAVILEFNKFTNEKLTENNTWSRTEAWELMSGTYAGGMFDENELDDPIRLRYAFALAYFIQRQNETELRDGLITPAKAAERIATQIEEVDYSPLLIQYYIALMHEAGQDCTEVERAYQDIVIHLQEKQGLTLGEDVELPLFWYFNDFGEYSVDDYNGVTPENRQWIRDRMSIVEF